MNGLANLVWCAPPPSPHSPSDCAINQQTLQSFPAFLPGVSYPAFLPAPTPSCGFLPPYVLVFVATHRWFWWLIYHKICPENQMIQQKILTPSVAIKLISRINLKQQEYKDRDWRWHCPVIATASCYGSWIPDQHMAISDLTFGWKWATDSSCEREARGKRGGQRSRMNFSSSSSWSVSTSRLYLPFSQLNNSFGIWVKWSHCEVAETSTEEKKWEACKEQRSKVLSLFMWFLYNIVGWGNGHHRKVIVQQVTVYSFSSSSCKKTSNILQKVSVLCVYRRLQIPTPAARITLTPPKCLLGRQ